MLAQATIGVVGRSRDPVRGRCYHRRGKHSRCCAVAALLCVMRSEPVPNVAGWNISKLLGKGGNAEVWRASRTGREEELALKLLRRSKVGGEPYKRFVREITALQSLTTEQTEGVVPLISFSLPQPSVAFDANSRRLTHLHAQR
jgi:serine/threonine protein kinase